MFSRRTRGHHPPPVSVLGLRPGENRQGVRVTVALSSQQRQPLAIGRHLVCSGALSKRLSLRIPGQELTNPVNHQLDLPISPDEGGRSVGCLIADAPPGLNALAVVC